MKFLNIKVDNITMSEAVDKIDWLIQKREPAYVVTPNTDHIVKLESDLEFKEAYDHASLVLTDGKPLIWVAKYLKTPIVEKVSGSDIFPKICELAEKKNYSMFFLGAAPGVADKAKENLLKKFPKLNVVGTFSPEFGFEKNKKNILKIEEMIKSYKPDILIVALGAPKQEKFIYGSYKKMGVPLSIGLGATLDFAAGNVKRAPRWMSNCGLEWLYRVLSDPKRLAKRYWNDFVRIIPIVKKYK